MSVPRTPHPTPFPPEVEATIFYYLSLKLSNLDAIKDLIALKNDGTTVHYSTLCSHTEHVRQVINDRASPWSKQAVRNELEKSISRDTLNHIADMDEKCVAVLRKASGAVVMTSVFFFFFFDSIAAGC